MRPLLVGDNVIKKKIIVEVAGWYACKDTETWDLSFYEKGTTLWEVAGPFHWEVAGPEDPKSYFDLSKLQD